MKKKDYFVRSCIYNQVCVVGKKVTVYQIVDRLQEMEKRLTELAEQLNSRETESTSDEIIELRKSLLSAKVTKPAPFPVLIRQIKGEMPIGENNQRNDGERLGQPQHKSI